MASGSFAFGATSPGEYMGKEPMTATEIRFRLDEFERSPAMKRMRQGIENTINGVIERVFTTPIQFRFPKSKKKRIRKKWRKEFEKLQETAGRPV